MSPSSGTDPARRDTGRDRAGTVDDGTDPPVIQEVPGRHEDTVAYWTPERVAAARPRSVELAAPDGDADEGDDEVEASDGHRD